MGDSEGKNGSNVQITKESQDPAGAPDLRIVGTQSDPVSASSVSVFACNSNDIASQYSGTNFTGVQSGPDGTALDTLDQAAAGFVAAGGGQAGVDAANTAIDNSNYPIDTGDNVDRIPH